MLVLFLLFYLKEPWITELYMSSNRESNIPLWSWLLVLLWDKRRVLQTKQSVWLASWMRLDPSSAEISLSCPDVSQLSTHGIIKQTSRERLNHELMDRLVFTQLKGLRIERFLKALSPPTLYISLTLSEKPSHDADHFKHKGEGRMKAESDHDTNGSLTIYGSLTPTPTSLYTPIRVQLGMKSHTWNLYFILDHIWCRIDHNTSSLLRFYTLWPFNNTNCVLRHWCYISYI